MAVRWPKQTCFNNNIESVGSSDADFDSFADVYGDGRNIGWFEAPQRAIVAPARYSAVRKVVFHLGVASRTIADFDLRLGVMPSTVDNSGRTISSVSLSPNSLLGGETSPQAKPSPLASSSIPYDVYGSAVTVPGTGGATPMADGDFALLTVEFDFFDSDPEVQAFFQDWNNVAASGDNEYIAYFPVVHDSGSAGFGSTDFDVAGWGMTIVQAPATSNNSCTNHIIAGGWNENPAAALTTYITPEGDTRWTYHESDWNGIDSITAFLMGVPDDGTPSDVIVRLREYVNQTDAVGTTVFEDTFSVASVVTPDLQYIRTRDFSASLVDGRTYSLQVRFNGSSNAARRRHMGWLEVIQKGFTKTATYHDVNTYIRSNPRQPPSSTTGIWAETFLSGSYFDPTWYSDIDNASISRRNIFFHCLRRSASSNPTQLIRIDTTMNAVEDNDSGGAGTVFRNSSGTAVSMAPSFTSALTNARDYTEQDIAANDPLDLLGARKIYWGTPNNTVWRASSLDSQISAVGIFYAFTVPVGETSDLGPLFELDAFNPEGCAATSAGLGEPGLLIITNGSSIPQKYNPIENVIEDAGIPTPYRDEVPSFSVQNVGGSPDGLGLTDGTYVYRYTFRNCCTGKESDPNPDDISVTVSASPKGQVTLNFNGVCIPGDPQICEICVYRTVNGGDFPVLAKVGCFDPDVASTFVDDLGDENLDFVNDGLSLLNAPMPCVPYIVDFRNRLFGAGDIPSLSPSGTVSVVEGSEFVTGDFDVEWTRCLEGKFIQVEGDCRWYEIERVLPSTDCGSPAIQQLELVEPYEGDTQTGANYIVAGRPNRLYFSEPFEPECWPVVNFIDVEPGDGDRITGLASNFDRLVVCKRNKTYVLAFRDFPALEVSVPARVSSDIGCIAPRSFAQVEVGTVWLADRGLALYDGRGVSHGPESQDANTIFTDPDNPRYVRRDANGRVIDAVGVWYPKREQYLLLLPTVRSDRGCDLMLVWDVKNRNVTLCEFCQEFQSMVVAKDTDGNERVYLGDTNGFAWIFDVGDTDGVGTPGATGTVRGTVTAAGVDSFGASFFDDSDATFIAGGLPGLAGLSGFGGLSGALDGDELALAGVCVYLRAPGTDVWTQRTVFASTETRIWVTPSWGDDTPEVGWEYMLGPIEFEAIFKPTNMVVDDTVKRNWAQWVIHEPEDAASELSIEIRPDFTTEDPGSGTIVQPDGSLGERTFFMDWKYGRQKRPVGRDIYAYLGYRFYNFAPEEPVRIINHVLGVEAQRGK